MGTLAGQALTMQDLASRLDRNDSVAAVIEVMNETNEILEDMLWMEGNLITGHKTTMRTGIPEPTFRKINAGVAPTKSKTVQVTDTCAMLEAYSKIDKALAELNGNTAAFRLSEDIAHIEGINQSLAQNIFYGNTNTDPEKFLGLAPRFNDMSAENGENILDGGGAGADNTSIWLVHWGDDTCHGIYPKGTKGGLEMRDLGEDTVSDGNGGEYQAYRTHYKFMPGLSVRNWQYVTRIANVSVGALTKDASAGADLIDLMVQAQELIRNPGHGKAAFYCNRTVRSFLRRQIANKDNVNLTFDTVAGKRVLAFDDVPVRRVDQILSTEAVVS